MENTLKNMSNLSQFFFPFLIMNLIFFLREIQKVIDSQREKNVFIDYFDLKEKRNTGENFFEKGDYRNALNYFEKFISETENEFLEEDKGNEFFDNIILDLKKERIKVLEKLAIIYETLKIREKEIECLEKIIKLDPYLEFPYKKLILIYEEINEKLKANLIKEKYESIVKNL